MADDSHAGIHVPTHARDLRVTPEVLERSVVGHRGILEALIARDVSRALTAADDHLVHGYEHAISNMPEWWRQSSSATLLPDPPAVGDLLERAVDPS